MANYSIASKEGPKRQIRDVLAVDPIITGPELTHRSEQDTLASSGVPSREGCRRQVLEANQPSIRSQCLASSLSKRCSTAGGDRRAGTPGLCSNRHATHQGQALAPARRCALHQKRSG